MVDELDRRHIADQVERVFERDLEGNLRFHADSPDEVVHVAQRELRESLPDAVLSVYDRTGLAWSDEVSSFVDGYSRANPRGRHGAHRPDTDGLGVTRSHVDGRFGAYRDAFGWAFGT